MGLVYDQLKPSNTNEKLISIITASPLHQGIGSFPNQLQERPWRVVQGRRIGEITRQAGRGHWALHELGTVTVAPLPYFCLGTLITLL